jgi:hypothetical protein
MQFETNTQKCNYNIHTLRVISGFSRGVNEIYDPLGSCAAQIGSCRRFGTIYRSILQGSSWTARPRKMEPRGCPETSVTNYQSALRNIP